MESLDGKPRAGSLNQELFFDRDDAQRKAKRRRREYNEYHNVRPAHRLPFNQASTRTQILEAKHLQNRKPNLRLVPPKGTMSLGFEIRKSPKEALTDTI